MSATNSERERGTGATQHAELLGADSDIGSGVSGQGLARPDGPPSGGRLVLIRPEYSCRHPGERLAGSHL